MSVDAGSADARRSRAANKRTTSAEKNHYMKPLLRLKQQEEILEKGLITAMENMKISPNLFQDILREYRELSFKRQCFLNGMRKNLNDISCELESVRNIATNPEEIQKLDINSYKQKLMTLSEKMQDFEKSVPLEILLEEGETLNSELRDLEPNLRKYERAQKSAMLSAHSLRNKTENKRLNVEYKDVDNFHALIAVTGHTEHWNMEDHLFFLKMRKKHERIPALVAAIQKKCPDLPVETIVNHEAWYKHYQNLRERQREAVKKWRHQKEVCRKKRFPEEEDDVEVCQKETEALNKFLQETKVTLSKSSRASGVESKSSSSSSSASSNDSEKKELIRKWRMEQNSKRTMDEEQVKLQARLKKEMEENRRRRRREKIQEALDEYKQRKTLKEQNEELREKCKYDMTLIKAFRKQDEEFTKKRRNLILRSKKPGKNDLIELKKVELTENRDYCTLMEPTKVWSEKCKPEYSNERSPNYSRYVKDVPRICVRWRNEVSEDLKI